MLTPLYLLLLFDSAQLAKSLEQTTEQDKFLPSSNTGTRSGD